MRPFRFRCRLSWRNQPGRLTPTSQVKGKKIMGRLKPKVVRGRQPVRPHRKTRKKADGRADNE